MPLPFLVLAGVTLAGVSGIGAGIHGGKKMKDANDTVNAARLRNERNLAKLQDCNKKTMNTMDSLGKKEMEIMSSWKRFSELYEKIKNRPIFNEIKKDDITLPVYTPQELNKAAVGASVLLGCLGGATLGTAGGFAAAGGTTAAVMALGTASTGTAISALSGAAATNATLAALGGGSIAAGGGGIALGTTVLGGATLGVGLLIGGIVFDIVGSSITKKADKAWDQMIENEKKINDICSYLSDLEDIAKKFEMSLTKSFEIYIRKIDKLEKIIAEKLREKNFISRLFSKKVNYKKFSEEQKMVLENAMLLVNLLYSMCKVKIVNKIENQDNEAINEVNTIECVQKIEEANKLLENVA